MDSINKDNASWFKNIKKNDDGDNVDIIPSDKVLLRASSSHTNHNVRNLNDAESSTKWTSNYSIETYKDDLYTNRQITVGDYSRGEFIKDGKNRKLLNDNQQYKDSLRNKINSFRNAINQTTSYQNSLRRTMKTKHLSEFQKTSYINYHVGNSRENTKLVPINDNISLIHSNYRHRNVFHDKFIVNIRRIRGQNYLIIQRTDWGGGWGDAGLSIPVYETKTDTDAYNRWYSNEWWTVYNHNKEIDRIINFSTKYYNSLINKAQNELNNSSDVNINVLPVKITNDGKYIGNKQTTLTNNSTIKGEWIEVEVSNTIIVKNYELLPGRKDDNPEQLTPFPKDFYLLGSNDREKWEILDSHLDYTPTYSDNNTPITFDINNKNKYTHIRLVIAGLNPAYTDFKGLGAVALSIFHLSGTRCYSLNKSSCETFQSYINNKNMSTIEGLTMMDEHINVLADLKDFNEKYNRYIKCHDITLSDNIKQDCTSEDSLDSVNKAYSKLMENGSIQTLQNTPLNKYSTVAEYETNKRDLLKTHSEIIPLRQELDHKLKILTDDKNSFLADYSTNYDNTMYTSLGLSVVLTSTLYFVFKQL